jgi:hypothetical protein
VLAWFLVRSPPEALDYFRREGLDRYFSVERKSMKRHEVK